MQFDKKIFFDNYRVRFGPIKQEQATGLDFLLDQIAADTGFDMLRQVAYLLATIKGETGTFQPRKEVRASSSRQPKLLRIQNRYWPLGFYGRGYVQLTHRDNYVNAGVKLAGTVMEIKNADGSTRTVTIDKDTFVKEPNLVMHPEASYLIASRGMREGWFRRNSKTGKPYKLSTFIEDGKPPDYYGARNIINSPKDKADVFAGYASNFELCLRAALLS